MDLCSRSYRTVEVISGPILFLRGAGDLPAGALVRIRGAGGRELKGQVLQVAREWALVQLFGPSMGLEQANTVVTLEEEMLRVDCSRRLVGRIFNGAGDPIDGIDPPAPEARMPIGGSPINPVRRDRPRDFIQTGLSAIDGFTTLVRGQKLPIFSGPGLPANAIAEQILRQARVPGEEESFAVVFAGIGITRREADFFLDSFRSRGVMARTVVYLNLADDPAVERLLTPRIALTAAEYLAFKVGMHILVIMTDMTNYCEALREVSTARGEIPGRRGYPGYLYTDLAGLYERAGRIKGKPGSVTLLPLLSMPDDDITHPIPDLTGYITEGQIVLSRALSRQGVFPPIDVLPSLSRLMNSGIGVGKTREDHRGLADQLYSCYAEGRDLRRLVAIVGQEALSPLDRRYLAFADDFERGMIAQGDVNRTIAETLDLGWRLLRRHIPPTEIRRVKKDLITKYFSEIMEDGTKSPYY
jgi:V/A-type H+-transporting ATPase subunit B